LGFDAFAGHAVLANSGYQGMDAFPVEMLADGQFCSGFTRDQKVKMVSFGNLVL
jgi:hypothetical protein